jgi:hypothetical protein
MTAQIAAHAAAAQRPIEACRQLLQQVMEDCGVGVAPEVFNRQIPAIAEQLAHALYRPMVKAEPGMGLEAWLASDDIGSSSLFIASILAPADITFPKRGERKSRADYPSDADDFGRCHRLLQVMPEWRDQLDQVARAGGPVWARLVANWEELTALYGTKEGDGVFRRITALVKEAEGAK